VINTPQGCAAIQRHLDRLERWADTSLLKFNTGKCQVLHLGRNNPIHRCRLGTNQLESNFAGKELVDSMLSMSQQSMSQGNASKSREVILCLCSALVRRTAVLCPELGTPVQESSRGIYWSRSTEGPQRW